MSKDKDCSDRHKNAWKLIELPPHLQKARDEQARETAKKGEQKSKLKHQS
jgi:hypothetical protein